MSPTAMLRLAWPDVLERTRSSGYFLTLLTTVWVGSLVYTDNIQMWAGGYRGVINAAWLGTVVALSATTFISLVGFYIVKDAIERDRRTGVGQILAATCVSTPVYLLAKWLSNFLVLATIVATLAAAAVALFVLQAETAHFDAPALIAPLVLLALPAMAVVAACAVLFESVGVLSRGAGNVLYVFVWMLTLIVPLATQATWADWSGISVVEQSLAETIHSIAPGVATTISFTAGPTKDLSKLTVFEWGGVFWTPTLVALRLSWIVISALLVMCAAAWFDRFDARGTAGVAARRSGRVAAPRLGGRPSIAWASWSWRLWSLADRIVPAQSTMGGMVMAELRLAFSGLGRWWAVGAAGLWMASLTAPLTAARYVHVAACIWPVLLWSGMGVHEASHRTGPLVFSCPFPIRRQFAGLWIAGVTIALVTGSGFAVRLAIVGDGAALATWFSGALLVPTLALALGVWSGSSRAFEALYTVWWYVGPVNGIAALDYTGAWSSRSPLPSALIWLASTGALLAAALLGRRRQMRG